MSDWKKRAEVNTDVVDFHYVDPKAEAGVEEIHVWDLDKTYLDTRFESVSGLWKTAFERAFEKQNVPGTAALVSCLKMAWQKKHNTPYPIYFITASPPQLERRIYEKLVLDGIEPFGLFCKDNLQNIRPKRMWRLTQQVGYKIQALLQLRIRLQADVRQVLWGDDSESDAIIYSLYSDICARRLEEGEVRRILKGLRVMGEQSDMILDLQAKIPKHEPVEKIYINLAEDTDAEYYLKFGRRTLPTYNAFQMALDLFQDHRLQIEHVVVVAQDLIQNYGFTPEELERALDDLIRRQALGEPAVHEIVSQLQKASLLHAHYSPSVSPRAVTQQVGDRVFSLEGSFEPWVPDRIDYLHDYR